MRRFVFLVLLALLPTSLRAGQIHLRYFTLDDVSLVFLVQLVALHPKTHSATVAIKKMWSRNKGRSAPSTLRPSRSNDPTDASPGETREVEIYEGVEWKDPHKHVIEEHYWDRDDAPSPGESAFLFFRGTAAEWVAFTAAKEAKLDRFFGEDPAAWDAWIDSKTDDERVALYADHDYRAGLLKRFRDRADLPVRFVMTLEDSDLKGELLKTLLAARTPDQREALFQTILDEQASAGPAARAATLRALYLYDEDLWTTAQKMKLYQIEVDHKDYRENLHRLGYIVQRELRDEKKEKGSLWPYARIMALYWRIHCYNDLDDDLPRILARLTASERKQFYPEVLRAVATSPWRREYKPYKGGLLRTLLKENDFRSDPALLWKMAEIDFRDGQDAETFRDLLGAMLDVVPASDASARARVKAWADRYLSAPDPFPLYEPLKSRYAARS